MPWQAAQLGLQLLLLHVCHQKLGSANSQSVHSMKKWRSDMATHTEQYLYLCQVAGAKTVRILQCAGFCYVICTSYTPLYQSRSMDGPGGEEEGWTSRRHRPTVSG